MDSRTGKKIRLGRVLPDGRGVVVVASHGVLSGPPSGLETRAQIEGLFGKMGAADAIMVTPGMVPTVEHHFVGRGKPAMLVHLDWKNHGRHTYTPGEDGRSEGVVAQLSSLEAVAAAGADGVMTYLYLGMKDSRLEREEIERNARIARDCDRLGLALVVEPRSYLGAADEQADGNQVLRMGSRVASDLGADIVKVVWPGRAEEFAAITETSLSPVLLAGGAGGEDVDSTVQIAKDAIAAGGAGLMFGRRVFRSHDPEGVLQMLRDVVHGDRIRE